MKTAGLGVLMGALGLLSTAGCSAPSESVGTRAQAVEAEPHTVADGLYRLYTFWSGGCVTVEGASLDNGANITAPYDCDTGAHTLWEFRAKALGDYRVRAQHSNKCMRARGDAETGNVQQGRCVYQRSRWGVARWTGGNPDYVQLISSKTGACAQLMPGQTDLVQGPCLDADQDEIWGQLFRLEAADAAATR